MIMEIARLGNVSWLPIAERQAFVMRAALLSWDGGPDRGLTSPGDARDRLPELDWPATLFEDEPSCH